MTEEITKELPVSAGEVFDEQQRLIGRYVYLQEGDQELLDSFFDAWLETYRSNEDFFITCDLETTGLKPKEGDILLVSISWDGKNSIIFCPHFFDLDKFKEVLNTIPLNNQNIKFDLKWLIHHYGVEPKIFLDTMVACQLGWAGIFPKTVVGTFSLGNIAKHLLDGFTLEKDTRKEFIGMKLSDGFTRKQVEYAVKDSLITHKLVLPILTRLINQELWETWEEIERPLLQILTLSELHGIKINTSKLQDLLTEKTTQLNACYEKIKKEIDSMPPEKVPKFTKGIFNPGSSQQIVNVLSARGIKVLNTEKATLQNTQAQSKDELLGAIIEWRKIKSIISKYLTQWLNEHIDPNTDKIYTTFGTYSAETGRMAAYEPNMMTVPPDLREMIIAPKGFKILSQDYGQYEFRAAAAETEEPMLVQAFEDRARLLPAVLSAARTNGFIDPDSFVKAINEKGFQVNSELKELAREFAFTDIHRKNASLIFNVPTDRVTSELRSVGKCVDINSWVHTEKGIARVSDFLPKKKTADTYYDLKGVKILTDEGFEASPQIYYSGKHDCLRITTDDGTSIICTKKHRFRSINKANKYVWTLAEDLKFGNMLFLKAAEGSMKGTLKIPIKDLKSTENDLFIELVLCWLKYGKLEENKLAFPEEQEETMLKFKKLTSFDKIKLTGPTKRDPNIYLNNQKIYDILSSMKELPDYLLQVDNNLAKRITKYFWNLDKFSLVVRSEVLAIQLKNLLLRLGIKSWLYTPSTKEFYKLRLYGQDAKMLIEDKSPESASQAFRKYLPYSLEKKLLEDEDFYSADLDIVSKFKSKLTKEQVELQKFLSDNTLRRTKIISIETLGKYEVADFVVPKNNTVVYNGLVSHNTIGYCVAPETKVLTRQLQWVTAESLAVGDKLMAFDEDSNPDANSDHSRSTARRWRYGYVEGTGIKKLPSYRLTFDDNTKFTCSENHQLIVDSRKKHSCWVMAKDLKIGDRLSYYLDTWEENTSRDAGWLAGIFDGEGWMSQANQLAFCQKEGLVLDKAVSILKKFNIEHSVCQDSKSKVYSVTITGNLSKKLEFLGSINPTRLIDNLNLEGTILQKKSTKTIASIEFLGLQDMVTLQTSTRTFISDGFGSHNSLLYGAGVNRVQESLAGDGFYYTKAECQEFLESFFSKLPKIKLFIEESHQKVLNPKFIKTAMGRKRYFELPPRFWGSRYETAKESAFREATNFVFQAANADATKKAIVLMYNAFQKYDEEVRPRIILSVHDELVSEVHESNAEEIAALGQKIMIETGREATRYRVEIEVSTNLSESWSK